MNFPITQAEVDTIEAIIDRVGLAEVAESISRIAVAKSMHLEENWQAPAMAKVWSRIARRFDKLVPVLELSDDILCLRSRR